MLATLSSFTSSTLARYASLLTAHVVLCRTYRVGYLVRFCNDGLAHVRQGVLFPRPPFAIQSCLLEL